MSKRTTEQPGAVQVVDSEKHDTHQPKQVFPYSPLLSVVLAALVFVAAQLLAVFVVGVFASLSGQKGEQVNQLLESSVGAEFVMVIISGGLVVFGVIGLLRARGYALKTIGLVKAKVRDVLWGAVGFLVYFPITLAVIQVVSMVFTEVNLDQKQELGFSNATHGFALVLVFISLVIVPAVSEEILFRGFIYTGLRAKLPIAISAVLTSALFASAHLPTSNGQPLLWSAAIDTFILSLVLVYMRQKSGSLWPGIFLHMIKNSLAFIWLFLLKS